MSDNIPAIFTPDNEPYLGRPTLFAFDNLIPFSLWVNQAIAAYTHSQTSSLTSLQLAASQIIPQGISIALSIRELIRQAYLFSALILVRPLIERAAVISYLALHPESLPLWHEGWQHGKRPSLPTMLQAMNQEVDVETAREICRHFNHIVHGDPIGAKSNIVSLSEGRPGYSVSKMTNNPQLCDEISIQGHSFLTVLTGRAISCFPEVKPPQE